MICHQILKISLHLKGLDEEMLKPYMYLGANITFATWKQQKDGGQIDNKGLSDYGNKVIRSMSTDLHERKPNYTESVD